MRALCVTTSSNSLAPDHPTGLWLVEFAVPCMAATEAGIDVIVASPKGGAVPFDPKTAPNEEQSKEWALALQALLGSVTIESVKDQSFDGVFIPGGHGPMVDLARDSGFPELIARHDAAGKLIAAMCHGPASLVYAKRSNGEAFFKGRRATGFTNTEERVAGPKDVVPFLLEDAMQDSGADFHSGLVPMLSHVEQDGNLLTAQNPNSSAALATKLVEALSPH